MVNAHRRLKVDLTLTTASIRIPFGLVSLDANQKVLSFEEKPVQTYFIGQMLWNRQVATQASSELLDLADGQGLVNLIQGLTMNGMVGAFQYAGPQITFNTEQELQKAEHDIISFYTQTI
jgi:NDP-sugar pyrophosphorylase family protein